MYSTILDAIDVDNEECKKALQIKQSWKELADTITLHDTFDPLGYAWLSKRGMYPGRMWMLVALVAGLLPELLQVDQRRVQATSCASDGKEWEGEE